MSDSLTHSNSISVPKEFSEYFEAIYKDRWPLLLKALLEADYKIIRKNRFNQSFKLNGPLEKRFNRITDNVYSKKSESQQHNDSEFKILESTDVHKSDTISRNESGLLEYYIMDPASYLAAQSLNVKKGDKVLDMCAAPGGKSLILAENLMGVDLTDAEVVEGELYCNEYSNTRRERLTKVIQNYIPFDKRQSIWVKGQDGNQFGLRMKDYFDKILLDAPCSGEQHLLQNKNDLSDWKVKRSKFLAQRQYSLLSSAYLALKPGGHILYSTCSINPIENDEVIKKILKRRSDLELLAIDHGSWFIKPEKTENGYLFLPDQSAAGPIFFSLLKKSV